MPKAPKKNKITAQNSYEQERLRIIFEYSPIAIWEEDFSALGELKKILDQKKVTNIRQYLHANIPLVKKTFRKLKILDVNQAAIELYGAKDKEHLKANLGKKFHKEGVAVLIDEFASLLEGQNVFETEFKSKTLAGKKTDVSLKVSVPEVYRKSFKRVIVTIQDISVPKKLERHLRRQAQTDGLTSLLNHSTIRARLEEEFNRAKRYRLDLSCMMIDLDFFKQVNDRFGHEKGNQVLKRCAKLIKKYLRDVDIIGRFGGDEFFVILPETPPDNARIAALRLKNVFTSEVENKKKPTFIVTPSIGISGFPAKDVKTVKDLIGKADKAMYKAKKAGRNQIVIL